MIIKYGSILIKLNRCIVEGQ